MDIFGKDFETWILLNKYGIYSRPDMDAIESFVKSGDCSDVNKKFISENLHEVQSIGCKFGDNKEVTVLLDFNKQWSVSFHGKKEVTFDEASFHNDHHPVFTKVKLDEENDKGTVFTTCNMSIEGALALYQLLDQLFKKNSVKLIDYMDKNLIKHEQ